MTFNLFLEGGHLVLRVILGLLDEVAQVNELFLVLGDLADALLHVVKGGRDVLDTVTAPLVDALDQLLLDTIGFLGQLDLKVSSLHLENWEVNDVVGNVQDLVFGLVELVEFGGDFFEGGLFFGVLLRDISFEQVLDQASLVHIKDVLVLLVLVKKSSGCDHVLLEHGLDLGASILEPLEVWAELEARLVWQVKEGHQVLLEAQELVGC